MSVLSRPGWPDATIYPLLDLTTLSGAASLFPATTHTMGIGTQAASPIRVRNFPHFLIIGPSIGVSTTITATLVTVDDDGIPVDVQQATVSTTLGGAAANIMDCARVVFNGADFYADIVHTRGPLTNNTVRGIRVSVTGGVLSVGPTATWAVDGASAFGSTTYRGCGPWSTDEILVVHVSNTTLVSNTLDLNTGTAGTRVVTNELAIHGTTSFSLSINTFFYGGIHGSDGLVGVFDFIGPPFNVTNKQYLVTKTAHAQVGTGLWAPRHFLGAPGPVFRQPQAFGWRSAWRDEVDSVEDGRDYVRMDVASGGAFDSTWVGPYTTGVNGVGSFDRVQAIPMSPANENWATTTGDIPLVTIARELDYPSGSGAAWVYREWDWDSGLLLESATTDLPDSSQIMPLTEDNALYYDWVASGANISWRRWGEIAAPSSGLSAGWSVMWG